MGAEELVLFSQALEPLSLDALARVVKRLSLAKRGEYESNMPALGDLVDMVTIEARKEHPFTPCGHCHSGMVIVERDGYKFARDCECKAAWRKGKLAS